MDAITRSSIWAARAVEAGSSTYVHSIRMDAFWRVYSVFSGSSGTQRRVLRSSLVLCTRIVLLM